MDDWMPDVDAPLVQRIRTFAGRRRTWDRSAVLLSDFDFGPIDETLAEMTAADGFLVDLPLPGQAEAQALEGVDVPGLHLQGAAAVLFRVPRPPLGEAQEAVQVQSLQMLRIPGQDLVEGGGHDQGLHRRAGLDRHRPDGALGAAGRGRWWAGPHARPRW